MFDNFTDRVRKDFARARFKAFLNRVRRLLGGQPTAMLSYDEVKEKLRIGGPVYRGVQVVPLEKIAGSLNRYHQFDRAFMPLEDQIANRWQNIDRAFYQDVSLPPVVLYKIGEVYFVVDGHHRVSVARDQGQEFIDAEVRECQTKVNITPDIEPEDLEILGEKAFFLERTNLDRIRPKANIVLTIPDGFDRMLEHIAVHRYFMGLDWQHDISEEEAVGHWYDTVYQPIVRTIRRSGILKEFPGKTEADLYLWVLDRQRFLNQEGRNLSSPQKAAKDFIDEVK
ncbi:MAG: transcriptional regulator [Chloroflexota bacterium]